MSLPGGEVIHIKILLIAVFICWMCQEVAVAKTLCIEDTESKKTACSPTKRVEIHSLLYAYVEKKSPRCPSEVPARNTKFLHQNDSINDHEAFLCSYTLGKCDIKIGNSFPASLGQRERGQHKFLQMNYSCVPESDIIKLCGDDERSSVDIRSVYLAFFQSATNDGVKNCTCTMTGAEDYSLTAVHVDIPRESDCPHPSLDIRWNAGSRHIASANHSIVLVNDKIVEGHDDLRINYQQNCQNSHNRAWLKLVAITSNPTSMSISCGKYAGMRPSSSTPNLATEQTTSRTSFNSSRTEIITATTTTTLGPEVSGPEVSGNISSTVSKTCDGTCLTTTPSSIETQPTTDDHDDSLTITETMTVKDQGAVIGGSVAGGVLFLVITAVCIAFLCRQHRRKRNLKHNSTYLSYDDGGRINRNSQEPRSTSGDHHDKTAIYDEPAVNGMSNNNAAIITEEANTRYETVGPIALNTTGPNLSRHDAGNVNRRPETTARTKAPVYSQVNKPNSQDGVSNNGRLHLYDHVGADEVEYDHIRSEQTAERATDDAEAGSMESPYHQLYAQHNGTEPADTERGLGDLNYELATLPGDQEPWRDNADNTIDHNPSDRHSPQGNIYHVLEELPQNVHNDSGAR